MLSPAQGLLSEVQRALVSLSGGKGLDQVHQLRSISHSDYFQSEREFGSNDRQGPFVGQFLRAYDDPNSGLLQAYTRFIREEIKPLYPEEHTLVVQTTPNLRVHIPGKTSIGHRASDPHPNVIGLHSDGEFSHSVYEDNYVFALTRMYDSNSIFYELEPGSKEPIEDWGHIRNEEAEYWSGKLQSLRHYNKRNTTPHTRMSLDFRVIPYSIYCKRVFNARTSATNGYAMVVGSYFSLV